MRIFPNLREIKRKNCKNQEMKPVFSLVNDTNWGTWDKMLPFCESAACYISDVHDMKALAHRLLSQRFSCSSHGEMWIINFILLLQSCNLREPADSWFSCLHPKSQKIWVKRAQEKNMACAECATNHSVKMNWCQTFSAPALLSPSTVSSWFRLQTRPETWDRASDLCVSLQKPLARWLVQLAEARILCNQGVLVLNLARNLCRITSVFFSLSPFRCFQLCYKELE